MKSFKPLRSGGGLSQEGTKENLPEIERRAKLFSMYKRPSSKMSPRNSTMNQSKGMTNAGDKTKVPELLKTARLT